MSEDRRLAVLRAIVEDYVADPRAGGFQGAGRAARPRGVARRRSATTWPRSRRRGSSPSRTPAPGRIPTDKGYRLFVDRLSSVKPLSAAEKQAIATLLDGAVDLDDVVDRTVRLLAQLTHQVAVVQYPSLTRSTVRHVELVPLGAGRLLVVLITNTGRVEQRLVDVGADVGRGDPGRPACPAERRGRRTPAHRGLRARRVARRAVRAGGARRRPARRSTRSRTASPWSGEERLVLAGTANLARSGTDFARLDRARSWRRSRSRWCCSSS